MYSIFANYFVCFLFISHLGITHFVSGSPYCGQNEAFEECGVTVEKTCDNALQDILQPSVCVAGCFCQEGYIRNSSGICVPTNLCSCSDENAEWKEDTQCYRGGTCLHPNPIRYPVGCKASGCTCKSGFVLNVIYGDKCVLRTECERHLHELTNSDKFVDDLLYNMALDSNQTY